MGLKLKSRSRKPATRKMNNKKKVTTVKAVKAVVNKVINKRAEVKKYDYYNGKTSINHNNFSAVPLNKVQFVLNNFGVNMPSQGDQDTNIDGTQYKVIGMQIFMTIRIAADRLNSKFRVLILRCSASKSIGAYSDIFDNVTGNLMIDPIDRGKCKVLMDKIIGAGPINPTNSTDDITFHRKFFIKHQKYNVKHEDNNSAAVIYPRYRDHMFIFGFDSHGSLQTDTIGDAQIYRRLYFTE